MVVLSLVTDRSDVYNNTVWLYCLLLLIGQMFTINTVWLYCLLLLIGQMFTINTV